MREGVEVFRNLSNDQGGLPVRDTLVHVWVPQVSFSTQGVPGVCLLHHLLA